MRASRNVAVGTSLGFRSVRDFRSTSVLLLPNKVPNDDRLGRRRNMHRTLVTRRGTNGQVNTVYTTPVILTDANVLSNGGTAYCPKFRRCFDSDARCATALFRRSNGIVANRNPTTALPCTCGVLDCFTNSNVANRLRGNVVCARLVRDGWGGGGGRV